jgi:DNA-binding beta-propeller fold protein YncE
MGYHEYNRIVMPIRKSLILIAGLLLISFAMGCAPQYVPPDYSSHFFPLPPEKKRLQLLKIVRVDLDVRKPSKSEELFGGNLVFALKKPLDVVADTDGTAYITDHYKGTIYMINIDKGKAGTFGRAGRWKEPKALAIDTENRLLGLIDGLNPVIISLTTKSPAFKLTGASFQKPAGIAFDPTNKLVYISDIRNHEIYQFDYEGKYLKTIGSGELYFPGKMATDKEGELYVVDTMHWKIKVFDKEGELLRSFGDHGSAPGMFGRPKGIAVSRDGIVIVSDGDFNRITLYNKMGATLLLYGSTGGGLGQFLNPFGVHIDDDNKVYIVDQSNRRVLFYQLLTDEYYEREFQKEVTSTPKSEELITPEQEVTSTPKSEELITPEQEVTSTPEPEELITPEQEVTSTPGPEELITPEQEKK